MRDPFKNLSGMLVAPFGSTDIDYFADMHAGLTKMTKSVSEAGYVSSRK